MHQLMAATLDEVVEEIATIQRSGARDAAATAASRPALADDRAAHAQGLDRPQGWSTGCRRRDRSAPTRFRSPTCATKPEHLAQLEEWLRSYRPQELFDERGALRAELAALAPEGERRMGANPHANGGLLLRELEMPDFRDYAVEVPAPGAEHRARRRACSGRSCAT